ncbi:MAG: hypothetical protein NTY09_06410 [bacterium]|nr:hypothetical protein [bacterium]
MYKRLIYLLIIVLSFSCSGKDPVSTSENDNNYEREALNFQQQSTIFPDVTDLDHSNDIYYDADVTEILQGPGLGWWDWGVFWEDNAEPANTWSVAVALREDGAPGLGIRGMGIRFLRYGVIEGEMSDVIEVVDEFGDPIEGNIRLPRIAACYFYNEEEDDIERRFVEVSVAYQIWSGIGWDIHVVRMGFNPDIDSAADWTDPEWAVDGLIGRPTLGLQYGDMMMPDIAYDPRTESELNSRGDLYLVYTWYNPDNAGPLEGPRVYIKFGVRSGTNNWLYSDFGWADPGPFGPPRPIHYLLSEGLGVPHDRICHGFHPKIDIGFISFIPGQTVTWTVAVAFTADGGNFEPHIVTWPAGLPYPSLYRLELPIRLDPYIILNFVENPGFMPSVDIGPVGANHCAVTWTQARSGNWNDVTVGYIDNHFGAFYIDLEPTFQNGIMEAFAFPSVAVWDNVIEHRASISYLNSLNPVTNRWDSRAVTYDTTYVANPPSGTVDQVGVETNISIALHGLYDSGSQYSNWYGISSSMSIHNGRYWVLYSAMPDPNTEDVPDLNLNKVFGAYGWTNY